MHPLKERLFVIERNVEAEAEAALDGEFERLREQIASDPEGFVREMLDAISNQTEYDWLPRVAQNAVEQADRIAIEAGVTPT